MERIEDKIIENIPTADFSEVFNQACFPKEVFVGDLQIEYFVTGSFNRIKTDPGHVWETLQQKIGVHDLCIRDQEGQRIKLSEEQMDKIHDAIKENVIV